MSTNVSDKYEKPDSNLSGFLLSSIIQPDYLLSNIISNVIYEIDPSSDAFIK